tara:strand:- start:713 stop:919 length:207 start_codon:yes stop_codon:yes gene_type:complete
MSKGDALTIVMYMLFIFSVFGVVGWIVEIATRYIRYIKIDVSDWSKRLENGEELSKDNFFKKDKFFKW